VNAIANELYITTAAKLANRLPNNPYGIVYYDAAITAFNWFNSSGMVNSNLQINDGLIWDQASGKCINNNGPVFTYNQGAWLSGITELAWSAGGDFNRWAQALASATISQMTVNGILHDTCDESDSCDGDLQQFKGVFARNVQFIVNRANEIPDATKAAYVAFLQQNADSVWASDQSDGWLGQEWSGPYNQATVQTQSSALDVIVGAASVS